MEKWCGSGAEKIHSKMAPKFLKVNAVNVVPNRSLPGRCLTCTNCGSSKMRLNITIWYTVYWKVEDMLLTFQNFNLVPLMSSLNYRFHIQDCHLQRYGLLSVKNNLPKATICIIKNIIRRYSPLLLRIKQYDIGKISFPIYPALNIKYIGRVMHIFWIISQAIFYPAV